MFQFNHYVPTPHNFCFPKQTQINSGLLKLKRGFRSIHTNKPSFSLPTKCAETLHYHRGPIHGLATLPNGHLASGSGLPDSSVMVKKLGSEGKPVKLYRVPRATAVYSVSMLMSNWLLAAGSLDGHIDFWNPQDENTAGRFGGAENGYKYRINSITAFLNKKYHVITGGVDGALLAWDTGALYPSAEYGIGNHKSPVNAITMFQYKDASGFEGEALASAGNDGSVKIWNPVKFEEKMMCELYHFGAVKALLALPSRKTLISGSEDRTIYVWNPSEQKEPLFNISKKGDGSPFTPVYSFAIFPDKSTLASGHFNGEINLWNLLDKEKPHLYTLPNGHVQKVNALAILLDGSLASGSDDKTIKWWTP